MWTSYLFLTIAALLPVVATIGFHCLNKYTKFSKLPYWPKQIIYGVVFGGLAIVGTHWGIPFGPEGATANANARDAAVIIGGLIFGGPAGIFAGTIGGLERMIVGLIPSMGLRFTVVACSASTFLAGIVSALIRKFVFENKRPGIISGFFIGFVIEVFHLFMVFVTNANEYQKAYHVVQSCTPPMLIANSVAVLIGILVINVLEKGKGAFKRGDAKSLTSRFTVTLSALTFVAFILSSTFVFLFNDKMATKQTDNNLKYAVEETTSEIEQKTIEKATRLRDVLDRNKAEWYVGDETGGLVAFCKKEEISEINIIDAEGYIRYSSEDLYVNGYAHGKTWQNYNMLDTTNGTQSYDFHIGIMNSANGTFVQPFRKPSEMGEGQENRKYAAIRYTFEVSGTPSNGYIQVGYNKEGVDKLVGNIAEHKSVGQSGALLVLNDKFEVVSLGKDVQLPEDISTLQVALKTKEPKTMFTLEIGDIEYHVEFTYEDTHYIVSLLPTKEAKLSRNISIFVNTFLEVIVFGLFFITIYVLVKKLVIDRIEKTNKSLAEITNGNLDVVLDGGNVTEFDELSEDINETVNALKGYIDAANKRIDEELAMAKAIQSAVLPSTFPAFPDRKEFDIYASMHPAKEVGGDFYDFYFSNQEHFHFTIADVSGKGIPAALFMMRAKSVLKSLTQTNIPINEVFAKGNNSLCDGNEAGMFVTAWSASVDLTNGELTFANGGHNPPLIKHKNGKFEYLRAPVNLVLAAMDGMPYGINKLKLEIGDVVYLYTDGVTEGVNTKGEQLGEERLLQFVNAKEFSSCKELCDYTYDECVKFADGAAQFDDITMVAFRFDGYKK